MRRAALFMSVCLIALVAAAASTPVREAGELLVAAPEASPTFAPSATVLFGGDLMFDRSVRQYAEQYGGDYLFACLDPVLQSANLVVANLEGPITDSTSVSVGSAVGSSDNYIFTFPPQTAALLARHHIGAVALGNNHIENFGDAGVRSTLNYLQAAGVPSFGDPLGHAVANLNVNGVPLALIGYNEFIPQGGTVGITLSQIAAAKAAGRVPIVYAHWGVEYATSAPPYVVTLAHEFVEAGAVAVIGTHPHVVEQHEVYDGAPIYYSLGNLIFDQYFSDAVEHGLMVELTVTSRGASVTREVPVVLSTDHRTCPAP